MFKPSIIITGASAGIGAATARACAAAGLQVVLNGRRAERLEAVAAECRAAGAQAVCVAGDVSEPGMSARLLTAAEERFGRPYAVFANAGYGFYRITHELSDAEVRQIFEVNFFAAFDLLRAAARRLLADAGGGSGDRAPAAKFVPPAGVRGHLLMCSSALAKFSLPYFAAYCATKAAQSQFCRSMRPELRPYGIEVACVHPITTETEFHMAETVHRNQPGTVQPKLNAPRWMVQPAERVGQAVVRCLKRPRSEVWTSAAARIAAGLMTMFPGLLDLAAARIARRR